MRPSHVVFKHRVLERTNHIVHASTLTQGGDYRYETTACGLAASSFPLVFWWRPPEEPITCLECIAEAS